MCSNAMLCQTLSNRPRTFGDLRFWGAHRARGILFNYLFFIIIKIVLYSKGILSQNLKAIAKELSEFLDFFRFKNFRIFLGAQGGLRDTLHLYIFFNIKNTPAFKFNFVPKFKSNW